ncbi:MAG: sporulation protein YtfJ [Clostridiales bacterium]|nr:sporulation protein YtfJ [Clostridiales bacterium]
MAEHTIENVMKTTMENLKDMIDVNTIVGDAVETAEGTVIVPISKVSFGFVVGGGDYKENSASNSNNSTSDGQESGLPFAGGSGAGVSVNPIAFLVVGEDKIKLLPVQYNSTVDRIVELVPTMVGEIQSMMSKGPNKQNGKKTETIITTNVPQ